MNGHFKVVWMSREVRGAVSLGNRKERGTPESGDSGFQVIILIGPAPVIGWNRPGEGREGESRCAESV